ncbi:ubiquitin-conjugating enzyme/RWD-like protein [Kickxella alabastrina]|uniref:ubiquitin-conjugating enzyme/RWD-like protein n=1 Tax=Kickxella alabastrina TaxID=61397 RepID=UPI00221F2DB6|nr:ubiquitin-conjugating enzyme/RWD-like protein [Kickxella alabastrina]KAI7826719.1 ubiquitin-conjugating enzyme/RWD-like protein [Kickxella alabastrina]
MSGAMNKQTPNRPPPRHNLHAHRRQHRPLHCAHRGPPETPYEAGQFHITISLPDNYPIEPPSMKLKTRIYHPNIDDHGNICLDVLKTGKKGGWNPAWTLGKVLLSLSALLGSPNPDDPLMPEIAEQMVADYSAFATAAREWTAKYAASVDDDERR